MRSRYGEDIPVRLSGVRLFEAGAETGKVCFLQDLREVKRLQRELIENERVAATGQAVAGMAHYIKNVLNGLQGGVYMVNIGLGKDKPERLHKGWAMVQNNINTISDLVMNMLTYSREREPDYEFCSPNEIAKEVSDLFDVSLKEWFLDPRGIHRCLLNLVGNAIDACILDPDESKDWSVVIRTRKEEGYISFDVVDNGMGMNREVQSKLFGRFFSTKGGKGTGLGLLVTQKIVDEQGGNISFESEPGKGTTFTMRFPDRPAKDERR